MEKQARMQEVNVVPDRLKITKVNPKNDNDFEALADYDAIIVQDADDYYLWDFIKTLRAQNSRKLYLKPVFVDKNVKGTDLVTVLFDGTEQDMPNLKTSIEKINSRIKNLSKEQFWEGARYKTAIIDDDAFFLKLFSKIIDDHQAFDLEWNAQNTQKALEFLQTHEVDVLFVDVNLAGESGLELIEKIKNLNIPHTVIVSASKEHALKAIELDVSDYLVKPVSKSRMDALLDRLSKADKHFKEIISEENKILKKLLEFIYSRGQKTYSPVRFFGSKLGYAYPLLSAHVGKDHKKTIFDILELAEKENYLEPEPWEFAYFCNKCTNSFLHYRETCPKCKGLQLQQEDLVHHFRCAYIGPVSDYRNQEHSHELICPKCDNKLKHIGVDYDKPSLVYTCRDCDHVFQEPDVKAKCIACGNDDKVEHLMGKQISSYRLTEKGMHVAKGTIPLPKKEKGNSISSDEIYFYRFLFKEIERKSESDFESCLAFLKFHDIAGVYGEMGRKKSEKLQQEIYEMITAELPRSAEINFADPQQILIIFPDKSMQRTGFFLEKLQERLVSILLDNLGKNQKISYNTLPISTDKTPREQIATLKNTANQN